MTIFEHIKSLTKHSFVYTISTFIQRALGFILLPVYTSVEYLPDRSAYGDLTLAYTFIAFMTIVYLYGMDAALIRYFFLGKYKREDVYKTSLAAVLANALSFSLLLYLFSPSVARLIFGSPGYDNFIKISALILLLDGVGNLPYHLLRAEERSLSYTSVRVGRFLLELALNIVFVVFLRLEVLGILYANLIASTVNLLVLIPFQLKYLKGSVRFDIFKTLAKFALPMLPNGLAYLTVEVSDKYLMRLLLDKDTLGAYSANYKFGSLLLLVVTAFRTAWQPFFLKISKDENAKNIYARVMTYFVLAGVFIIIFGSYFIEYIVRIPVLPGKTIMGSAYWHGTIVIPIVLTAYLFYGIYVNLTVGIYIEKKTRLMVIFTGLAALVNVGSNLYLMPAFGMIGAAMATLLSYVTMAVSIFIANQRIYPIRYEYGRLGILLTYLSLMLFLYYYFDLTLVMRIVLFLLTPVLFLLSGFFRKHETDVVRRAFRRLRTDRRNNDNTG